MPALFAHRGAHRTLPENTMSAFARAFEEGADGVELDVRLCATDTVVVIHDPDLVRLAGRPDVVAELPWPALARIDLGHGERVPRLDDAIDLVMEAGGRLNIEVKGDGADRPATATAVTALLSRRTRAERAAMILSTFDPVVLAVLRATTPGVPVGQLVDPQHVRPAALVRLALRPDGMHPHASVATPARVRRWRRAGQFVNVWTVNDPAQARHFASLGVDALITDDVPVLQAALERPS